MDLTGRKRLAAMRGELSQLGDSLTQARMELADARQALRSQAAPRRPVVVRLAHGRRDYMSGAVGDPLTHSWTSSPKSADYVVMNNLRVLRARSRYEECNNDYVAQFLSLLANHVVGPSGIILQANVMRAGRGPKSQDQEINAAIEAAWSEWGEPGVGDVEGARSWIDNQILFVRTAARDGEYLARIIRGRDAGPHGMALQVLDPELLDIEHNENLPGGNFVRMGIECNAWSRPVAYHLLQPDDTLYPGGNYGYNKAKRVRVPAEDIIHVFLPLWPGQKRGIPWAATALLRLRMLSAFEDAAVINARAGASKIAVVTSPAGEAEFVGDATNESGVEGGDHEADQFVDFEAGGFYRLDPGQDLKGWSPDYPRGEFPEFVKACLRGIAAGLNVDYAGLSGDLTSVNYSSIRAGVLEQREVWKRIQAWMIGRFCARVYREWLRPALLMGRIVVPSGTVKYTPEAEDRFHAVRWQPRRWSWVDPQSDMAASVQAIEQGLKSRSQIIRDQGDDPDDVWQEVARERSRLEALGLLDIAGKQPIAEPAAEVVNPPSAMETEEPEDQSGDDDDDES